MTWESIHLVLNPNLDLGICDWRCFVSRIMAAADNKDGKSKSDINLRLILVSGKTKDFPFLSTDSAGDIAKYVFDHWPDGNI